MRDEASLINWLSKLAEHQIIAAADYHGARKRDRGREVAMSGPASLDRSAEFRFEYTANTPLPDERVAGDEETALVESCVSDLPEEYRELVILRNYVGASWETVAELTGRPTADAARMMHARAMIDLGKLLKERGASA
jgi:DNA-directed RNA polymerase specialized sigma24 family protein